MTQQTLLVFVLVTSVFLAGASIGQMLMRIRIARLERINMRLDRRRLNALARAWQSRAPVPTGREDFLGESGRDDIEAILSEIENA